MTLLRGEPAPAFRFLILLGDSGSALKTGLSMLASAGAELLLDGGFSDCTGMQMEQELYPYKEGGLIDYVHKKPGRADFGNITLKWGMGFNNSLWDWLHSNARHLAYGTVAPKRKDGTIISLPYAGLADPLKIALGTQVWYFRKGVPVRWSGPQFNAATSQSAIESLEIAHEGLERWYPPNLSAITDALTSKIGL